jgi:translation initiation factor IF-2
MQGNLMGNMEAMLSGMSEGGKEKIELPIVLRADGPGSAEALASSLKELISEDEYFKVSCKVMPLHNLALRFLKICCAV